MLGRAGTTGLEFALVAIPFVFLLIAGMDLGRYFITQHSLRTLTSELARATLVYCSGQSQASACTLPASGAQSVQSAEANVPFLASSSFAATPTALRSSINQNTGEMTITASAAYNFDFVLPFWTQLNGAISEQTTLKY